jgi:hypothetical protein
MSRVPSLGSGAGAGKCRPRQKKQCRKCRLIVMPRQFINGAWP